MATQEQKNIFSSNLKKHLRYKGITQTDFANNLNYPEMTVSNWINAKYYPRIDKIQEMADYFNIKKSDLIEDNQYSKINFNSIKNIIPLEKAKRIPILGTIACGEPIFADENFEGYFITDSSIRADFALKCKGDSMIDADIFDGDLVFLKKTSDVDSGKIAAVLIDNEATLKRVIKTNDTIFLQPANKDYAPIVLNDSMDILILGEAVGVYHYIRDK